MLRLAWSTRARSTRFRRFRATRKSRPSRPSRKLALRPTPTRPRRLRPARRRPKAKARPTRARKAKMKVKVQTLGAKAGGDIELNDEIFAVEPRADILHRVVTWQL